MAEAFARAYGSDVIIPASAGLAPASRVAPDTLRAMAEKTFDIRDHFPKSIKHLGRVQFDLVVNMSGLPIPLDLGAETRSWAVEDPVSLSFEEHCGVRDIIERLVMELILELRKQRNAPKLRPFRPQL